MSAAVDVAPQSFGRHTLLDGMARPHHHSYHDPYAPNHGNYNAERFQQAPQTRQLPLLPPVSTIISPVPLSHSLVLANGRERSYSGGRPSHYADYATPSPVGQMPPQLPTAHSDAHSVARRTADVRHSPIATSGPSTRTPDELSQDPRFSKMSSIHDHAQPSPQAYHYPQSPRPRAESFQHERAIRSLPVSRSNTIHSYSSPPSFPNGRLPPPQLPRSPPSTQPSTSPRQETKSMSISNLLSTETDGKPATNSLYQNPPPLPPSSASLHQPHPYPTSSNIRSTPSASAQQMPEYRITVRQQPLAARSCGFGERDRRVIDPPPIVQLVLADTPTTATLTPEERSRRLRHQFSVVHCSIWDETGTRDMSSMPEDFRQQRRLMGTLVASPFVGLDDKGEEGCFFCFPDLSCRTPGTFRLKFALVMIDPTRMHVGHRSAIVATVMSEPFQVFNAKDFPGMQASTPLTKRLKEQGCLISIKKGNEKRDGKNGSGGDSASGGKGPNKREEDDDDDDDEGSGCEERATKRLKR